ncbi:hypothetical protein [Flectobacillus sp. BAB-3569]|uniref:hypothetical protein n=1 Tax=Flectobacillus sp. BAB-3569 TaxID=1509483 RepID=UPI000BA41BEA|nr:hypothetical protein [Flectobacillus sp. BAB-3569]PAC30707.1 hypothetical protein BWI92_11830 [Flectobacillus sp. BAB-3569]
MTQLVYTVCSISQIPFALALGEDLQKYEPNTQFVIGLADRLPSDLPAIAFPIVAADELGLPFLSEMANRYTVDELTRSLKPYFASFLAKKYQANKIIFLESQTQLFQSLSKTWEILNEYDIVLSPNITQQRNPKHPINEPSFLNAGLYNAGFWGYKPSTQAESFLTYWKERTKEKGYFDFCHGFGAEQLWLNFIPIFQENVYIQSEIGVHYHPYNWVENPLTMDEKGNYVIAQSFPLQILQWQNLSLATQKGYFKNQIGVSESTLKTLKKLQNVYLSNLKKYTGFNSFVPSMGKIEQKASKNFLSTAIEKGCLKMIDWIEEFEVQ